MQAKQAVPALIESLKDEHRVVRHYAAGALADIQDYRAILPLIDALSHSDSETRSSVQKALVRIAGKGHGFNQAKWRKWLETANAGDDNPWMEK